MSRNILSRLKVIIDRIPVDAKTDVDLGYFTVVAGRPIEERFNRRDYIKRVGEIAFVKEATTGISKYLVKRKINLFKHEKSLKEVNASLKFHELQSRMFMYNEFNKTEEIHKKEKAVKENRLNFFNLRLSVRTKLIHARCRLYKLEEHYRTLRVYQALIYQLSPLPWRKEHDHIHCKFGKLMITELPTIYGPYRLKSLGAEESLKDLIDLFYHSAHKEKPAEMYFTHPSQLQGAFDYMVQINAHGNEYLTEVIGAANEMRGYYKEISKALENQLKKIQKDHDRFTRAYDWVNNRKQHLRAATLEKRDDVMNTFMGDKHLKVRREVLIAGDKHLSVKKLNMEMTTILNMIQGDAHYILHEYLRLPPKVKKMAYIAVHNKIQNLTQIERNSKTIVAMEKHLYEAFAMRTHPKLMHKDRSDFPIAKKPSVAKSSVRKDDDFYTEDIFDALMDYHTSLEESQLVEARQQSSESNISHQETRSTPSTERSDVDLVLPDRDSIGSVSGVSISKLSTATNSTASSQAAKHEDSKPNVDPKELRRKDSASFYPNNTVQWMEIDVKKIILEGKRKLLVKGDGKDDNKHSKTATPKKEKTVKRKEFKEDDKIEAAEIGSKCQKYSHRIHAGALRDEFSTVISETSSMSKDVETFFPKESHFFNAPEYFRWKNLMTTTSEMGLNKLEQTKTKKILKTQFRPHVESQAIIKFLQSPYFPTLPATVEKPDKCQVNSNPLEFMDPKIDKNLRGLKQTYYQKKTCPSKCKSKEALH
ncbi:uncharacterized protein LOC124168298 isoform X2 [Ischnura elegans]|nr:uncharacterized protein LOC124168298 isoform X2 [Ischnura elegans]